MSIDQKARFGGGIACAALIWYSNQSVRIKSQVKCVKKEILDEKVLVVCD